MLLLMLQRGTKTWVTATLVLTGSRIMLAKERAGFRSSTEDPPQQEARSKNGCKPTALAELLLVRLGRGAKTWHIPPGGHELVSGRVPGTWQAVIATGSTELLSHLRPRRALLRVQPGERETGPQVPRVASHNPSGNGPQTLWGGGHQDPPGGSRNADSQNMPPKTWTCFGGTPETCIWEAAQ